uniref:hypothetical protein n=1 Tax=Phascolarctobacterium succinatutens TaxID=626940 RepID=UPI00307A3135
EIIAAAKTFFSFISIPPFTDIPQKLLLSSLQRAFIVTDECKTQSKLAVKSVLKRLQKWKNTLVLTLAPSNSTY